mmetsp:Transcript_145148/g.253328  ORF Transcript_145148/g.253328 Transcript_145148/m.253328 type:complete len:242 (+) Transcript_145148:594-1319(+)
MQLVLIMSPSVFHNLILLSLQVIRISIAFLFLLVHYLLFRCLTQATRPSFITIQSSSGLGKSCSCSSNTLISKCRSVSRSTRCDMLCSTRWLPTAPVMRPGSPLAMWSRTHVKFTQSPSLQLLLPLPENLRKPNSSLSRFLFQRSLQANFVVSFVVLDQVPMARHSQRRLWTRLQQRHRWTHRDKSTLHRVLLASVFEALRWRIVSGIRTFCQSSSGQRPFTNCCEVCRAICCRADNHAAQ